jgi:glycosyltransferase involved in cell wall biosynthesis
MKIALVYPRANIDTVPTLVGAVEQFADCGYDVDVFTYIQAGQPAPDFGSARVRLRSLGIDGLADHSTARLRRLVKQAGWLPGVARAPLSRGYQALGAGLAGGSRLAARARGAMLATRARGSAAGPAERYACVIGVDPDGLALAHRLAQGAPLGYISLELLLSHELGTAAEAQLKAQERELSRQASFVVVQDQARARLLADDNGLAPERLVLVPNAPPGPARRQPTRFWHTRFDLPADARVVIHSGSLGDWTGIEDIVASVPAWPEPWVLVVHTRYDAESSGYVEKLRSRADPRRVRFSLKPVRRQDYDALIDGADVGLAFYVSTGASSFTGSNVQTIGLSSGKLAYYLRSGLPVVVNRVASISADIEAHRAGAAVDDASALGAALQRVAADYDVMSARACAFFEHRLAFGSAFAEVVRRVDALA